MDKKLLLKMVKKLDYSQVKITVLIISFILMTVLSFFTPITVRNITDKGMIERNLNFIVIYSLILLMLYSAEQIISLIQTNLYIGVQNRLRKSLFSDVFSKLLRLKLDYFEDKNSTEIFSRMSYDIQIVSRVADSGVLNMFNYILRMVSGSIGLLTIEKRLAVVVLVFIPIKYFLVTHMSKKKEKLMDVNIEKSRELSSWFSDNVNGIRELKLWNLHYMKQKEHNSKQDVMNEISKKSTMMDAYNGFSDTMLNAIIICLLYFVGGWMVCCDQLSVGSVIAFITYSAYVTGPISSLLNMKFFLASIAPSAKKLFDFLELEEELSGDIVLCQNEFQSITFENVSYSYNEKIILKDISFHVPKGNKVAIIGKNGSGKTTILKLLLQLIQPNSGIVLVNDQNITKYSLDVYRSLFSVVSQDVYLFQGSILSNIDIEERNSNIDILLACKKSYLEEYLMNLPDGLNTIVGSNGVNLSGGERQKLAMARAIIKNAQIVVLDEATSNYDIWSNDALQESLATDFKDKTIIMITHDYKHLEKMDIVYELSDGILQIVPNNFQRPKHIHN